MKLNAFFDNFGLLADAPNGVQRLREMILQLAVQGKLVPQAPGDEPASVLLEKIKAEKERLVNERKIKKNKPLPPIKSDEIPYELPNGWKWERLDNICSYIQRGRGPKYIDESNIPVISQKCIQWDGFKIERARFVDPSSIEKYTEERFLQTGDLLWNSTGTGTIGRVNVYSHEENLYDLVVADSHVTVVRPIKINSQYIYLFLASPVVQFGFEERASGTTNQIELNTTTVKNQIIAVPPVPEQKRIVAKVDELMALCDELEVRKQQVSKNCIQLNDASIHKLLKVSEPKLFNKDWQRICDNFELLYSKPENVAKLRQAILQLAVQGKLVPQDPKDEPASVLLEKIKAEKERLVKEGRIKKSKPLPLIDSVEVPYELPVGWEWCRFPEIGDFGRGKSKHRPRNAPELYIDGTVPLVQTGDVARSNGRINTYTGLYNEKGLAQSKLWNKGTMCITIAANIADSGILGFDACFPDSVVGFVPSDEIGDAKYFEYFMRTAKSRLTDFASSTAQKNINLGILQIVLIPLPPAPEIKRIVAKVEDLMALCDELEASILKSQTDCDKLMEAAVTEILAA